MKRFKNLIRRPKDASTTNKATGINESPAPTFSPPPNQNLPVTPAILNVPVSEPDNSRYQYGPLKAPRNFRIFHLKRRPNEMQAYYQDLTLEGSMIEASLDNPPAFFALSYVWGDPSKTGDIRIDGRTLTVTTGCISALRRMLRGKVERIIWVDAICINQASDLGAVEERSMQVSMMDEIYRKASQVLVHLGDGDAASDAACAAIKQLGMAYLAAKMSPLGSPARASYETLVDDVLTTSTEYPYTKLHGVFRSPWFRRSWTYQEAALSQKAMFYCGDQMMAFDNITIAADFSRLPYSKYNAESAHWKMYLDRHHTMQECVRRREQGESLDSLASIGLTLLTVLVGPCLSLESSRPEDKVYGIYGVCKKLGYELPVPDYNKPVATIYTEAAQAILRYDRNLRILSVVEGASSSSFGLPSWVPNFSGSLHKWSIENPPHLNNNFRDNKKVSGLSQCDFQLQIDPRHLRVKGRRVDKICAVSNTWKVDATTTLLGNSASNTGQVAGSLLDCIGSWFDVIQGRDDNPRGRNALEIMTEVLMNDNPSQLQPHGKIHAVDYLGILVQRSKEGDPIRRYSLVHPQDSPMELMHLGFYTMSRGMHHVITSLMSSFWKTMFRTTYGYLGMGSYGTALDDLVIILHGTETPCLVRPCNGGFTYVGAAYVSGTMNGEFWNSGSEADDEWFVLV